MDIRHRPPGHRPDDSTPSPEDGSSRLEDIRQRARSIAEVGGRAIARALSSDPERFLRSSRQQGGQ